MNELKLYKTIQNLTFASHFLTIKIKIMKIKSIYFLALSLTMVVLFSCSKDKNSDPTYSFINQDLQGEIGGDAWTYVTGTASISYFDSTELSIDIFAVASEDPCSEFNFTGNRVIFSIPDAIGLYELNLDFSGDPHTVTLFHEATTNNNIAVIGAIEITSIDKVNGIVEGRLDAQIDNTNFVNGNFSINYCVSNW